MIRLKGDITKLDTIIDNVYVGAIEWFQEHVVKIIVYLINRMWNRFGNANWGDIGVMQLFLTLFYSIEQYQGPFKKSMVDMVIDFNPPLQQRQMECELLVF